MIDDVRQAALDYHCHPEPITLTGIDGVVHAERNTSMLLNMRRFAHRTIARKLAEMIAGADIFLGLSAWLKLLAQSAHSGHSQSGSENHAARCGGRAADAIIAT